jgi:hypothetical protein
LEKQLMGMMGKSNQDLRSLRQAAMAGDHSAARHLLRLYGHERLAREIKRNNLPFPPRVATMVGALTAGTGEGAQPGPWEVFNPRTGEIENDLQFPPVPRRARQRKT